MPGKITGRVEVLLNGEKLLNKAGAVAGGIGLSGIPAVKRKAVMGDDGIHGYVDEPTAAYCEVTITDRDDISLDKIAKVRENGTIIFRTHGGGKSYVMEGATCLMDMAITAGEGETPVRFEGNYWVESTE